ncbi:MAG: hypothetical protein NC336_05040 [Clostridium sp.]|nr:hypothetical protein [Clostridium sp.]
MVDIQYLTVGTRPAESAQAWSKISEVTASFEADAAGCVPTDYQYVSSPIYTIDIRAVVADGRIRQITHYYPYGLLWAETTGLSASLRK